MMLVVSAGLFTPPVPVRSREAEVRDRGAVTFERGSAGYWDDRYTVDGYLFGTEPNRFLVERTATLTPGRALSLGDGEGRNGVWLAEQGFEVVTVDLSQVAVVKARRLAAERGVVVDARVGSIRDLRWEPQAFDLVLLFFVHLPGHVREGIHRGVVSTLRPGGSYLAAGFTLEQVARGGRGPGDPDHALSLSVLRLELDGLEIVHAFEGDVDSDRGGSRHVVELHARRPGTGYGT